MARVRYIRPPVVVALRRGVGAVTLTAPVSGRISSDFGPRVAPVAGATTDHKGVDFAVGVGTPVAASAAGTVTTAGMSGANGNLVVIDHGGGIVTKYAHLSEIDVAVGQYVDGGDVIGLSGATGTVSGPNLHFGVYVNGVAVDPESYLVQASTPAVFSAAPDASSAAIAPVADAGTGLDPLQLGILGAIGAAALWVILS